MVWAVYVERVVRQRIRWKQSGFRCGLGVDGEGRFADQVVSPDGKLVAAGSLDTMVRVWNVQTGQQVERLKGHKDSVYR